MKFLSCTYSGARLSIKLQLNTLQKLHKIWNKEVVLSDT